MKIQEKTRKVSKKIRAGDRVLVTAGNSKGQNGIVIRCTGEKVLIQGVNMYKKHVKRSQQNPKGGITEIERPMNISNVCPCDESGMKLKVKVRFNDEGQKELVSEKDGQLIAWRSMKHSKE
jgi:large subunit ribosomal protein L24